MKEAFVPESGQSMRLKNGLQTHAAALLETLIVDTNGHPAHIQRRLEGWFNFNVL